MREMLLSECAGRVLRRAAAEAHPFETGGILVGVYSRGRPWVTQAIEVQTANRGPRHFVVPTGATGQLLSEARNTDRRLGYLGEWHVHPLDVGPSRIDRATMKSLLTRADGSQRHPILLIVRRRDCSYELEAREWRWMGARLLRITAAGDLQA